MSGYPPSSGEGEAAGGMNALLAQLRAGQDKRINLEPSSSYGYYNNGNFFQATPSHGYQPPSASSPIPTPPAFNQQPRHSSAVMSPAGTPQPQQSRIPPAISGGASAGRTTLLNLLKFQQPSADSPKQPDPIGTPLPPSREPSMSFPDPETINVVSPPPHGRQAPDLLAALMGTIQSNPTQQSSPQFATSQPPQSVKSIASPPPDTQAYLLQLLNRPKPSQTDPAPSTQLKPAKVLTPPSKASSQGDVNELTQALEEASLDVNLMGAAAAENIPLTKETTRAEPPLTKKRFTYENPFDELARSSPRVRTPRNDPVPASSASASIQILKRNGESTDNKRKMDERSNMSSSGHSHSKRKLGAASQVSSGPPTPLPDGRTPVEALIGIGASGNKETVAGALSDVGDKVDKQVQEAIARAEHDENQAVIEKDLQEMLRSKTEKEFEENAQVAAQSIKKELDKAENSHALDDLPTPLADFVKDVVDDTAQGHIADSWESADAEESPTKEEEVNAVKVYNFPMKPWTSITIKDREESRPTFRDEVVMDIARLKKEFDQVDRTLVTASNNFIVYGMSKNGGIRIIRQDDGRDARLFTETHDRIFNVAISVSQPDLKEAIIGTGISGTVYWAVIKEGAGDHIEESNPEMHGFAIPPIQSPDNESPGGVLKTRARKSSSHPEFFAVGRGKAIHIIWPSVIMNSCLKNGKDRMVDTDKYLAQYSLKVNTGKAGKDFAFSEDDSTIVSLDKAGRVKFWDVRGLTRVDDRSRPAPESKQMEIKDPLITFTTTPANEKSWPTSVMLVDKLRPYQRGGALRYLIVGMKQNHSLQLWDLALGKPVQEIHLPHGKESDAVCSVLYHAATGMIIVGHPTRNSIYFLHLSAPKYNLPKSVTQAEYIQKLVSDDPTFPKPDSTAVISGMREYSLENKGTLRSLDILQTPSSSASIPGEPVTLFELYAMHSKGVTCITIKQAELGWTIDNKVINPVSGEGEAIISIHTLKEIPVAAVLEAVETAPQSSGPTRIIPRPASKETASRETPKKTPHTHPDPSAVTGLFKTEDKTEKKELASNGAPNSGTEKQGKGKRRKATSSSEQASSSSAIPQNTSSTATPSNNTRNGAVSKSNVPVEASTVPSTARGLADASLKDAEARISDDVKKILTDSLSSLFQEIKNDRRTQSVVASTNQESLLRLVSKTLADNVDVALDKVVTKNIEKSVIPVISDITLKAVNQQVGEQLGSKLTSQLGTSIPKELQRALPDAIGRALQQPQLLKLMSESLAKSVAFKVEEHFAATMQKIVVPAFENLAVQTSRKVAGDVQRQAAEQINNLERQRQSDSVKIEQLMQLVTGLTETVSSMAAAQTEFQGQFLKIQQQVTSDKRDTPRHSQSGTAASAVIPAPIENEQTERAKLYQSQYNAVVRLMNEEDFAGGVITWLQSGFIQELFESYFCKYNPEFIRDMNSVILLSIGSAVSEKLDDMLMLERLSYLEMVVNSLQIQVNADTEVSNRSRNG